MSASSEKSVRWQSSAMQGGFTVVPNIVLRHPDLSGDARWLYTMLAHYAWQDERCFPGQDTLHEALGMSVRRVRAATRELEAAHLIGVQRRKNSSSVYTLLSPRGTDVSVPSNGSGTDDIVRLRSTQSSSLPDSNESGTDLHVGANGQVSFLDAEKDKAALEMEQVQQVFNDWQRRSGKVRQTLTERRKVAIRARLRAGYPVEDLLQAVRNITASAWHREHDKMDVTLVFRSDTELEKYRDMKVERTPEEEERERWERRKARMAANREAALA